MTRGMHAMFYSSQAEALRAFFKDKLGLAGTDVGGLSPRGTGNPADYEAQLTQIFKTIINTRTGRLMK